MKREEALRYIKSAAGHLIVTDRKVVGMALLEAWDALRQPGWVRTADRVPEVGQLFLPIVKDGDEWAHGSIRKAKEDVADKALDYWISIPPLPETVGVEGTKTGGDV